MTSKRLFGTLSRGLLLAGALFVLAGMAWTAWMQWHQPPDPVETSAGAVVLSEGDPGILMAGAPGALPTISPSPAMTAVVQSPATDTPALPTVTPVLTQAGDLIAAAPALTATLAPSPTATLAPSPTPAPAPPSDPPTRIVAPAIHLDAKVVPTGYRVITQGGKTYTEWLVPQNAAGWHETSAPPGQIGNTVISGHHNIYAKVFRYVVNLKPGDKITLYAGDRTYTYVVVEKMILREAGMPWSVREKNAQWIAPTSDNRLTLITCWPYYWPGNSHRVVVVAVPVE